MRGSSYIEWIWFFYHITLAAVSIWTAVLFFKQRSAACWCLLIGSVILALGKLTGSAIYWLGPFLGFHTAYPTGQEKSAHLVLADIAWQASGWGTLVFLSALWFVLRKKDESTERIAELEAALLGDHPHPHTHEAMNPATPPAHE